MPNSYKLSRAQVDEIVRRGEAGESYGSIATDFDVTTGCISYHLRRHGHIRRPVFRVDSRMRAEILRRWQSGANATEIAEALGLGATTVAWHLRDALRKSLRSKRTPSVFPPKDPVLSSYLAAIFDAEGCISANNTSTNPHWQITITNSSPELRKWIEPFGGHFYDVPLQKRSGGRRGYRKRVWAWKVSSDIDVLLFLEAVIPYLVIKRARAREVLKILHARRGSVAA